MTAAAPGVYGLQVGAGDGSPRSVLCVKDRATMAGNVVIEVGHQNQNGHGWAKTEHVVVTPDELLDLLAELAEHWLTANPDAGVDDGPDDPPEERFHFSDVWKAGWLLLHWAGIPAADRERIDPFVEVLGCSAVPDACATIAAGLDPERTLA